MARNGLAVLTMAGAAMVMTLAPTARAQMCIPPEGKKRVDECPGGKFKASVTKRPQVSFSSPSGGDQEEGADQ